MKIYEWIDKYNAKNSRKIILKYNRGIASGKGKFYCLHPKFYPKYLLRLLLVISSVISFKKRAYKTFHGLLRSQFSPIYKTKGLNFITNKLIDIFSTLFGYRYFVPSNILPLRSEQNIMQQSVNFGEINNPLVSIVIPVFNNLAYTYNCLLSLAKNTSAEHPYEVIVIDDFSSDATPAFFETQVTGINYIRNETNRGFLISSNIGAKAAVGKFICFLNNDTQITPKWLDALINTFEDESVGLAGCKLIYANGFLQEAGGCVFSNANAANYGNNQDPDHPFYNYLRCVDYCSGASIMIKNSDLKELNYFDERYIPAYYEDTDLCFAVRHKLKKKVVYQPFSTLIHFEGISSGTDVKKHPIKKFQEINKIKFEEKWVEELKIYGEKSDFSYSINKYNKEKTILIVDDTIPEPDKYSGWVRIDHIIRILKSLGHHIIYVPNDGLKKEIYFEKLARTGVEVLYKFPNRKMMLRLLRERLSEIDIAWLCKPQNNAAFAFIFNENPSLINIYDTIDLHFLRLQREADLLNDDFLKQKVIRVKEQEINFAKRSDITLAITNDERELLKNEGIRNVFTIPNIHVSELNLDDFKPFNQRKGLLFIGGYGHAPNIDAAKWLVEEIMPLVWQVDGNITLTLLGSDPTPEVLKLKSNKVTVPGYLEDVSSYFNSSRIFVAPLRYGAGMKGKIGQSLSYGLPIITTKIGSEGIGLINGKDYILADSAKDFAIDILQLYNDEPLWNSISNASIKIIKNYHPDNIRKDIEKMLSGI